MAAWPVVLRMHVDDPVCAKKARKAVEKLRGVESVWASPERGLVVVHGTADAWALRRRIWRKMKRRAEVVSDGSAPYHYSGTTAAPHYGPSQAYLGWGAAPPPHAYYSHPQPPPHAYYSHPPPPPPPGYPYAAGGYDGWAADPDPYGYAAHSSVPWCSIM